MEALILHAVHQGLGARFTGLNGAEVVAHYGDQAGEHAALCKTVGVLDLSFRGRICLTGADRVRFLHGQVTNDIKALAPDSGCYAALTNAKGKMQADMNIYRLTSELLLDIEPGLTQLVSERLEKYIVADDVQIVDASPLYGLLSIQGPRAEAVLSSLSHDLAALQKPFGWTHQVDDAFGETYLVNQPRLGTTGFDLYAPTTALAALAERLQECLKTVEGRFCGWEPLEVARIEAGIPRFGIDMDETNFPQECGIEARAVSYTKGCYIGQETLNRIHTLGHVNRQLVGLWLADDLQELPNKGDKLVQGEKIIGHVTSAAKSSFLQGKIALASVRNEAARIGTELRLENSNGHTPARVVGLPFRK